MAMEGTAQQTSLEKRKLAPPRLPRSQPGQQSLVVGQVSPQAETEDPKCPSTQTTPQLLERRFLGR